MLSPLPNPLISLRCTPRPCPECYGAGRIEHPAWRAALPLIGPMPRRLTADVLADFERRVLEAMIAAGFEDDCLFTEFTPVYTRHFYELPPRWIPCACQDRVELIRSLFDMEG